MDQYFIIDFDSTFTQVEALDELARISLRKHPDREKIYNLIHHLPPDKLDRIGIHPKFGKLTISEWTEFFLLHEAHHLYAIFQLAHSAKTTAK